MSSTPTRCRVDPEVPNNENSSKVSQGKDISSPISIKDLSIHGRGLPWYVRLCRISDDEPNEYEEGDKVYVSKSKSHWFPSKFKSKKMGPFTVHKTHSGGLTLMDKNGVLFEAQATWALQMPP